MKRIKSDDRRRVSEENPSIPSRHHDNEQTSIIFPAPRLQVQRNTQHKTNFANATWSLRGGKTSANAFMFIPLYTIPHESQSHQSNPRRDLWIALHCTQHYIVVEPAENFIRRAGDSCGQRLITILQARLSNRFDLPLEIEKPSSSCKHADKREQSFSIGIVRRISFY